MSVANDLIAEIARQRVIELFAGPGGYSEGLAMLGLQRHQAVGIEFEDSACLTAEAAGHRRLRADVTRLSPLEVACFYFPSTKGAITLFHASPPCQGFSMAGKGKGREDGDLLREVLRAVAAGHLSSEEGVEYVKDNANDDKSHLSIEPIRWIGELLPEAVTLEQVPTVLPLWEEYATVLRAWGYNVVTGNVQAEQYGVPQTRKRAILLASRVREVSMPVPTHSKYHSRSPQRLDEGVLKWVSMAEALGWGMTHRPYLTISPGVGQGGPDSLKLGGSGARKVVAREHAEGRWIELASRRDSPAWVEKHGERANRTGEKPAPTITGEAHRWRWTPTPALEDDKPEDIVWPYDRPSPTIVSSFRPDVVAAPGYRKKGDPPRQRTPLSVRVTTQDAAVLQGFPYDYPWHGKEGKRFQQIGNAVPPPLAARMGLCVLGWASVTDNQHNNVNTEREEIA